jgi:uncharacterized protein (TIGR02266 family)
MSTRRATRLPRVPFTRALRVKPEGDAQEPLELEAVNLSLGGLFVKAGCALPLGTRVSLDLAAAGRLLDFAEGEVVWARSSGKSGARGFGVRFTRLRPNARALVEHLVARGGTGDDSTTAAIRRPSRGRRGAAIAGSIVLLAGAGWAALTHLHGAAPPAVAAALAAPSIDPARPLPAMSIAPEASPPRAVEPSARAFPGEFQFTLPTGAVSSLRVTIGDQEVAVTPALHRGATIRHVFTLTHPARLVIDVSGREPRFSWQLEGTTVVKSVRIGARNHGTRVVVDLPEPLDGKRYRVVIPTS